MPSRSRRTPSPGLRPSDRGSPPARRAARRQASPGVEGVEAVAGPGEEIPLPPRSPGAPGAAATRPPRAPAAAPVRPEMPQSRRWPRSAPPPAHHRHTGTRAQSCRGTPGGARLGSRDRALRVVSGEEPPAAQRGRWGYRRLPDLREVAPRSLGQPGGAAAGQSCPLSPHLPPATWPHAPGPASGIAPRRPTPRPG